MKTITPITLGFLLLALSTQPGGGQPGGTFTSLNRPPVADAGPDTVMRPWQTTTVFLGFGASYDPEGRPITWWWRCLSHPYMLPYYESNVLYVSPVSVPVTYVLEITVIDDRGKRDTDVRLLHVRPAIFWVP